MVESWTDERLQKQIDYYAKYLGLGENENDQSDAGFALDALRAFQECRKQLAAAEARCVEQLAERDEAYRRGVLDGIELVRHQIHEMRLHKSTDAEDACDRAAAWFKTEGGGA